MMVYSYSFGGVDILFFFFFKQKTAYEMRISDWSSDVCSSDLNRSLLAEDAIAGLKVGVYQHSTFARDMMVDVLRHYGAEVHPLGRSEIFIPVDTEAVSAQTVASLQKWSGDLGLDAIISADGDGDRPLVADESGTPLRGDLLGLIAANFLAARTVVTPVTSNSGIEVAGPFRSEEHTSELQSLMRISYAVFCLKKTNTHKKKIAPQLEES